MAMMAKMRSLAPAFIITVGALFVLFMIISDSNVLEVFGARTNNVGSVNGHPVTYQEFTSVLDRQREMQKNQTGEDIQEENMDQFRDQVWDAIVTQRLVAEQIDKFGITVSDEEIRDIITGNNPPEFLRQSFIDSTGNFNRELYDQAIYDPQNRDALLNAEEYVRQNRLNEKLQTMLYASITVSEEEIRSRFMEQNTSINAKYALVDINSFPDSVIEVSEKDMKSYYNEHRDQYKIKPQRKLKFVLFENKASSDDSATVKRNLENVKQILEKDTVSFESFVDIYSDSPYSKDTVNISAVGDEAAPLFSQASQGDIIGPVATMDGVVLYNLVNVLPSNEVFLRASHILINQFGDDEENLEEANKIYNQLVSGADFAETAREISTDKGSGEKGGDLGWFGRGQMVPEFEKAVFSGKLGEIQKPVKTAYGYHIIKVTGRSDKKFVVEKIVNQIKSSASTVDANYNAARDFAYVAEKNDFEKEAEVMNYNIQETTPFDKEAYAVPGLGMNKRIIEYAFANSKGSISDVFRVAPGFAVVQVSEVIKEGFRPFEELETTIRPLVLREKKFAKAKELAEKISSQLNNNIERASEIDSRVTVGTTGTFTPSGVVPQVGRDYSFSAAAMELPLNKISEPVKGSKGYYLIQVTDRIEFDQSLYDMQRTSLRDNIYQEKKNSYFNLWLQQIKKDADIVDNRYIFYGQ
jgi:peptidyl-prolyl cis-trans isomerase D